MEPNKLERFLKAQETDFHTALAELSNGRKQTHWMWYIFPQNLGLGFSDTAIFTEFHSSITLFASVEDADPVFEQALDKFFNGLKDDKTLRVLKLES